MLVRILSLAIWAIWAIWIISFQQVIAVGSIISFSASAVDFRSLGMEEVAVQKLLEIHKNDSYLLNELGNISFVVAVAARTDNPRALANEALIFIRPFHQLNVPSTVVHDRDSSMIFLTSRSWYGLASSPNLPDNVVRTQLPQTFRQNPEAVN